MSRRIDLSLFQGDGSDDDDDLPLTKAPVELDDRKTKVFSYGVTKKTKWDLEKEAEEKKRLEDEEATRLALQEFSEAFATPGVPGQTHGHGHGHGWRSQTRGFVRAGENAVYNPAGPRQFDHPHPQRPPPHNAPIARPPSPPPPPKRKGKRAMDSFLEEIKSNQDAREARFGKIAQREGVSITSLTAHQVGPGNRPLGAEMTNLFVVNLPTDVSEDSLGHLFASVGPVGTVKIMWPRGDDDYGPSGSRRPKPSFTGFVSYMTRADAEQAIAKFDEYEWNGSVLRVSWSSKAVPIPRNPAYQLTKNDARPAKKPRTDVELVDDQQDLQVSLAWFEKVTPERATFIQAVADRIKNHGAGFKNVLMEREVDNPQFSFLFNEELPDFHVFQYCLDDSYQFPELPQPHFEDDGYASVYSTDSAEEAETSENAKKNALASLSRRRFEAMLRGMSGKRVEIARAMEFTLKKADAAEEVTNLICESLRIDSTPIPRKMARLHLISDILHNIASPLPNVWKYRQAFEKQLPAIFAHFAEVYDRLLVYSGTIAADVFRQQVDAVLTIWERWIVFTAEVHESLRGLLHKQCTLESLAAGPAQPEPEQPKETTTFKSAGFKSSFKRIGEDAEPAAAGSVSAVPPPPPAADIDGEGMNDADSQAIPDQNLDGEALAEDVDGEPLGDEDLDGEDLDGEDLDGEDLDGEAVSDADLDGEALGDDDVDGEVL